MDFLKALGGWLWTLPLSLAYLPIVLTYGPRRWSLRDGLLCVVVDRIWIGYESTAGQTVGSVIAIEAHAATSGRLWRHERHHARRQFWIYGMLFPFMYGAASIVAAMRGGNWYWDNRYEIEARAAEDVT